MARLAARARHSKKVRGAPSLRCRASGCRSRWTSLGGATLGAGGGAAEVAALAPVRAAGLSARVLNVGINGGQVTYALRGGLELRVGSAENLPLKLAIARQILGHTTVVGYLDVSVPERPVAGDNPQVSGKG